MPWTRNAQIAEGIAQTDSWNGVSWIPKLASEPWIRRIEAIARKMSSPKNNPTLSVAADIALTRSLVCYAWLRPPVMAPVDEGGRLADSIGWALVLPQMLAALGVIFAAAGVGTTIGTMAGAIIPSGSVFLAVLLYALGMVVFTMIMGNAFAAFPVMVAAIGVPILIHQDGGNPAVIGAVGMLSGFCGTLMTPMAANFNIVPAALLELKNQYGVIKAQVATALPLLAVNILILYFGAFR